MAESRDVAIVGMAGVFPGAPNVRRYWRNIVNGVDAIDHRPAARWRGIDYQQFDEGHESRIDTIRGGFIDEPYWFDPLRHKVMPNIARYGDADQLVLLDIVADALADANVPDGDAVREATDLIVGRGGYASSKMVELYLRVEGIERTLDFLVQRGEAITPAQREQLSGRMRHTFPPYQADVLASSIPNFAASRAANRLDLGGAAYIVDAACASSLLAVEQAIQRLRDRRCELAVAAGCHFAQYAPFWALFERLRAMSPSGMIRPFSAEADGLLMGEGAGAVVLKRADAAARDGDRVYAIIKGAGSASDGRAADVLAPATQGQQRALRRAYDDAQIDPATLGYLEAHGTGTALGDRTELASIRAFFGDSPTEYPTRAMGSVKSMIGHLMPAAGIAGLIRAALALSNKILPPSLHCERPRGDLAGAPFYVNTTARPWINDPRNPPRRAGVNAFGFGGINAHVVLEEVPEPVESRTSVLMPRPVRPMVDRPSELLPFAADTRAQLVAQVRRAAAFIEGDRTEWALEDLAFTLTAGLGADHKSYRLAVLATSLDALAGRLAEIADQLDAGTLKPDPVNGVYPRLDSPAETGKVAAIFPGMGFPGVYGEYAEHLLTMAMHWPTARVVLDLAEARDRHPEDPYPTSFQLVPPPHVGDEARRHMGRRFARFLDNKLAQAPDLEKPPPPDDRLLTFMGLLVSNWLHWQSVCALGVKPDMICGQSLGDVNALWAAGLSDYPTSLQQMWRMLDIWFPHHHLGRMGFVACTEQQLQPVLDEVGEVWIAIHGAPRSMIIAGAHESVRQVLSRMRQQGVLVAGLPYAPIHTPRMAILREHLEGFIEEQPLGDRPAATIYSAVHVAPLDSDPEQMRRTLWSNLTHTVRFWQTLRKLYDDGARVFVQVGGGTLSSTLNATLDEPDLTSVETDVEHQHPLTQIQRAAGQMFAHGMKIDASALFRCREPRPLDLDRPAEAPPRPASHVALALYRPPFVADDGAAQPADAPPVAGPAGDAPTSPLPLVGRIVEHEPGRRIRTVRRLSVEHDRYLEDHTFVPARGVKPTAQRMPVLPMTFAIEAMAQAGAHLAPGMGLVGFDSIRAHRWIDVPEAGWVDLTLEARAIERDQDSVIVETQVHADGELKTIGRARFARGYREELTLPFTPAQNVHRLPTSTDELYRGGYLFHGPRFAALRGDLARGDGVMFGHAVVPETADLFAGNPAPRLLTDPVVLDCAGQVLGMYMVGTDYYMLPVGVERIELYQPTPPPGTRVPIRVQFKRLDIAARHVSGMMEIGDGRGGVWMRVDGWQDIVFPWSRPMLATTRDPWNATLAHVIDTPGAGDATVVALPAVVFRHAQLNWIGRTYLTHDEFAAIRRDQPDAKAQRQVVMSRAAAKDAARLHLAHRPDARPIHPAQMRVEHDSAGRPVLRHVDGAVAMPHVSVAHKPQMTLAIAADRPVGIDLEPLDAGEALDPDVVLDDNEQRWISELADADRPTMLTRLWCIKEAAAKAAGTGLAGRPKRWQVTELHHDTAAVRDRDTGTRYRVATMLREQWMIAVAQVALADAAMPAASSPLASQS